MAHLLHDAQYLFGGVAHPESRTYIGDSPPYHGVQGDSPLSIDQLNPYEIYELTIGNEVSFGKFLPIKWAKSLIDKTYIEQVAESGHLDCLIYLHEEGCPWNETTCEKAARNGHLDILKYLHEEGCPWDESTCKAAAMNGHLDCLIYLRENGCPWNKYTFYHAAYNGHLDMLKYLQEEDCP